ncbi:MAG: VanZ family protein [Eubacteriales bacterium]|nr:VanZ family protein [Eubacteriales bacterium]
MRELVMVGYEFFCVAIFAFLAYGILRRIYKKKGLEQRPGQFILLLVLTLYVTGVFHVTGAGTIYHIRQYGLKASTTQLNLIPFSDPDIDLVSYLLNIVLLIPLGFLLPLIWPEMNRLSRIFCFGASFSLLIEASQMLNLRNSDVDDLLLNTLGAIIGWLLFLVLSKRSKGAGKPVTGRQYEAILYFAVMYLGYFLLFNEFGAAKILYGF